MENRDSDLLRSLGVPIAYGIDPFLPSYTDAVELEVVERNVIGRWQKLAPQTALDWRAMRDAAADSGVVLLLVSGYRSIDDQAALFRKKLAAGQAIDEILQVNAAPGYSQHHTGKAVDIATPQSRPLTEEFGSTAAYEWLTINAVRFGFAMPYTRENRFGICFEPWHWSQLDN